MPNRKRNAKHNIVRRRNRKPMRNNRKKDHHNIRQ